MFRAPTCLTRLRYHTYGISNLDNRFTMVVCFVMYKRRGGFLVAETFTGTAGEYVDIKDTIRGFKEILEGKHDELPEQAFYMVGGIEQVQEKAKKVTDGIKTVIHQQKKLMSSEAITTDGQSTQS